VQPFDVRVRGAAVGEDEITEGRHDDQPKRSFGALPNG